MASSYNMQPLLSLWTLECSLLLLTSICFLSFTAKASGIQEISEPVNGSATFKCPVNENREIEFVYFQKDNLFVNGHHSENSITVKWNNTKMDKNFTFYMYNLEPSLSGHYKCIIMYKKAGYPDTHEYYLTVTVPYSKPSFTKECNNRNDIRSCQVTCMAHDGYPSQKIWIVLVQSGNDTNGMVTSRNDSVFNLTTKLFSSTVTAEFNCSNTEVEFVCSVGGVVSETISICSPPSNSATIITACTVPLALLLIAAGCFIYKKCRKNAENNNGPATNATEVEILNQKVESKEEFRV